MLCTAKVWFDDGSEPVMLHRYIDFEMGAYAPLVEDDGGEGRGRAEPPGPDKPEERNAPTTPRPAEE